MAGKYYVTYPSVYNAALLEVLRLKFTGFPPHHVYDFLNFLRKKNVFKDKNVLLHTGRRATEPKMNRYKTYVSM